MSETSTEMFQADGSTVCIVKICDEPAICLIVNPDGVGYPVCANHVPAIRPTNVAPLVKFWTGDTAKTIPAARCGTCNQPRPITDDCESFGSLFICAVCAGIGGR